MSRTVSARCSTTTRSGHGGQRVHDMRLGPMPRYVDTTRSHHNDVIIEPPTVEAIADAALERRQARYQRGEMKRQARSIRRDGTVAIKGIITFGVDAQPVIDALSHDEQAQRYRAAAEAVAAEVGTDLVGLVIHRDEGAPHAHFTLSGYAPNGDSVARKLTKGCLSQAQDAAATAYEDLGISRGKKIGARIADGEDPSSYINRSVTELHRDLPDEVAAARAKAEAEREKAEKAEQRRVAAQAKADEANGQVEKLQKRVANYERRAGAAEQRAREAEAEAKRLQERLEALADADQTPPKQYQVTVRQTEERGWGPFKRETVTGRTNLVYFRPSETKQWRGAVRKREQDARKEADRRRKDAEAAAQQRDKEVKTRQRLQNALIQTMTAPAPCDDTDAALWATEAVLVERYGVQMQVAAEIARVPPQEGLSDRQIAAALYRHGREQGWERQWFSVSTSIAREIIALAREDNRLDCITFRDDGNGEATSLLQEALDVADADPMAEPPSKPSDRDEMGL